MSREVKNGPAQPGIRKVDIVEVVTRRPSTKPPTPRTFNITEPLTFWDDGEYESTATIEDSAVQRLTFTAIDALSFKDGALRLYGDRRLKLIDAMAVGGDSVTANKTAPQPAIQKKFTANDTANAWDEVPVMLIANYAATLSDQLGTLGDRMVTGQDDKTLEERVLVLESEVARLDAEVVRLNQELDNLKRVLFEPDPIASALKKALQEKW